MILEMVAPDQGAWIREQVTGEHGVFPVRVIDISMRSVRGAGASA